MSQIHVVAKGEHGPEIASKYGFSSFDPIWNHADNESLRKQRKDPGVLLAGDEVFIPDFEVKHLDVATDKRHVVVVQFTEIPLRLRLLDALGEPIAGASGTLVVNGRSQSVTTDDEGTLEAAIPSIAKTGELTVDGFVYTLAIGHLDPENTAGGASARLVNLGYRFVEPELIDDDSRRPELLFATELFAHDQKISTRSIDEFLKRLRELHGC